jgi:hypothetical protein
LTTAKKPSDAQLSALRYYAAAPSARRGLTEPSEATRAAAIRHGWLRPEFALTDAGRAFLGERRVAAPVANTNQLGLDELLARRGA